MKYMCIGNIFNGVTQEHLFSFMINKSVKNQIFGIMKSQIYT